MSNVDLSDYLETLIHAKSKASNNRKLPIAEAALGELNIYHCLRRILKGNATFQDKGTLRAVNNVLEALGLAVPEGPLR